LRLLEQCVPLALVQAERVRGELAALVGTTTQSMLGSVRIVD
jgi:hypothetical protein